MTPLENNASSQTVVPFDPPTQHYSTYKTQKCITLQHTYVHRLYVYASYLVVAPSEDDDSDDDNTSK